MSDAPSDSQRLAMLDMASSIKMTLTQYLDDNCVPGSSWGALAAASRCMLAASRDMKAALRFGGGKTEYMSNSFRTSWPLPCDADEVQRVETHHCLGIPIDSDLRMSSLLRLVEHRGSTAWRMTVNAFEMLGLPMWVCTVALHQRVVPKSCYGAEFLILRADWKPRMDAMLDRWLSSLLNLGAKIPRAVLMQEFGERIRLSTRIAVKALRLLAQIEALPTSHAASRVLMLAADSPTSWTRAAMNLAESYNIPSMRQWAMSSMVDSKGDVRKTSKPQIKNYVQKIVWPAVMKHEECWWTEQLAKYESLQTLALSDVLHPSSQFSFESLRVWCQLRLQNFLSLPDHDATVCGLCGAEGGATLTHLLSSCPPAQAVTMDVAGYLVSHREFTHPATHDEILVAVNVGLAWKKELLGLARHG
jgi:hypothetical protein